MTSFIDAYQEDLRRRKEQNGTIKVAYADFWPEWNEENFIRPILERYFNVVVDQQNPDVLFHSIFGNSSQKYKCKKILYVAENIRYPYNATIRNNINIAFNSANYTITFDPPTEKNYRLPLWQVFILRNPEYLSRLIKRVNHDSFERFCSFTVSNGSNFMRNAAFQQLSQYKRVHSYGRFMTNHMGLQEASKGRYWRDAKDEFFMKHTHKFMMAYENTPYPWYCTEKIMDAFLVGSIPIYWGDPKVGVDWNSDAFINAGKLGSSWIDVVKKIDQDKSLFDDMYNAPIFTELQRKIHIETLKDFEYWLIEKIKK